MDSSTLSFIESQISTSTIFVVSKTSCKACTKAKKLLNQLVIKTWSPPCVFEVDTIGRKGKKALIKYLSSKTGIKTVPQIWINGSFVGGNDDIQQLHREGLLVSLIRSKSKSNLSITGNSFSTRSPSPSGTFSVKSAPTPILVTNSVNNRFQTVGGYGRKRSYSDRVTGFATISSHIPRDAPNPARYGDEKWDISAKDLEADNSYLSVQTKANSIVGRSVSGSNMLVDSRSWSVVTSTEQLSSQGINNEWIVDNQGIRSWV